MNKKVVMALCAVLIFFAGSILADYFPDFAPLIVFLATCGGFVCGLFFNKFSTDTTIKHLYNEIECVREAYHKVLDEKNQLMKETIAYKQELTAIKETTKETDTVKTETKAKPKKKVKAKAE